VEKRASYRKAIDSYHHIGKGTGGLLCVATVAAIAAGVVVPIRCKSWACKICAPINAFREAVRVANGMRVLQAEGDTFSFITLTQPPKVKTLSAAYAILPDQWDKFRNRWQYAARKEGKKVQYAAFVEGQPRRGHMPHFHIIGTALPSRRVIKSWAVKSGFGHQADCQPLRTDTGVAWYVSKYSAKASDAAMMPKGFRRVRYSEAWPPLLWRLDDSSGHAIVRMPGETALHWSHRAACAFGGKQSDYIVGALQLLDRSRQRDGDFDNDVITSFGKV
jgi:hypothetical protein